MDTKTRKIAAAAAAALLIGFAGTASAAPVDVSYTVTGTAGNWTLNFDVANNLTGTSESLYFFGVSLDARDVTGSPAGFNPNNWALWSNAVYGGSANSYNNNWLNSNLGGPTPGTDTDGFTVHSSDVAAPTSVDWFAFGVGSDYEGAGAFRVGSNPGFEGVATSAVPEPANLALLLAGLGLVGVMAKRRAR
jgi:hypothetical protein